MLKNGMVLSVEENQVIVMTDDGEFCRVKAPVDAVVGKRIQFYADDLMPKMRNRSMPWRRFGRSAMMTLGGIAALVAVSLATWKIEVHHANASPYAFVALDISPGIKITVDHHLDVIDLASDDATGQRLIRQENLKHQSLHATIRDLVKRAARDRVIPHGDNILIATAPGNGITAGQLMALQLSVRNDVRQVTHTDDTLAAAQPQVYAYTVSDAVWNVSVQKHVSPAEVAAYVHEMNQGRAIPLNELHLARLSDTSAAAHVVTVRLDSIQSVESMIDAAIAQMKQGAGTSGTSPAASVNGGSASPGQTQTGGKQSVGAQSFIV